MATTMNCPGCQAPLRLRDDLAGQQIKCPRCGQIIAVPDEEAVMLEVADDDKITADSSAPSAGKAANATRPCPECGEAIALTATTCRHCRAILDEDEDEDDEDRRRDFSRYKPCPRCGAEGATRVTWTPWGSFYGPILLTHVRCPECGHTYNGKNGRSNLIPAILFISIPLLLVLGIVVGLIRFIHHLGYF